METAYWLVLLGIGIGLAICALPMVVLAVYFLLTDGKVTLQLEEDSASEETESSAV